jgi:hypothetical protein
MQFIFLSLVPAATFASLLTPEPDACAALCRRVTGGERTSFCNPATNTCENLYEYGGIVLYLDQPVVGIQAVTCDEAVRRAIGWSFRKRERGDGEDEFIRSAPADRVEDAIAIIHYGLSSQLISLVDASPDIDEMAIMAFDFPQLRESVSIVMSARLGTFEGQFLEIVEQFASAVRGMVDRVISYPPLVRDNATRAHFVSDCIYVLQMLTIAARRDNTEVAQLVASLQTHLPDTFGGMETAEELLEALLRIRLE